jgi:DNA-binding MarR family transcriptional regulator
VAKVCQNVVMSQWTFLTHHGHVLVAVAQSADLTMDQIAAKVGITTRATAGILNDLVEAGYIEKTKLGRNNHYTVHGEIPLRHPLNNNTKISELLSLFGPSD